MPTTRPTLDALYGRRTGSFAGKPAGADGPHPVGRLTRIDMMALYSRQNGSFAGKTASVADDSIRLFPILGIGF